MAPRLKFCSPVGEIHVTNLDDIYETIIHSARTHHVFKNAFKEKHLTCITYKKVPLIYSVTEL